MARPKLAEIDPAAPSRSCACREIAVNSRGVIPSSSAAMLARKASYVMSLAFCISASSAADLIIRQPAVTGSAIT